MKTVCITVKGETAKSRIECRSRALGALKGAIGGRSALLFTDSNVDRLYGGAFRRALPGTPVSVMPAGEEHKTPETLLFLLGEMAKARLNRRSVLIAAGGGVVGDIGGLAASLYMRGIACIQVPTTLLAQVDSSVGGKTAIDFCGVKNLVGAFHQPERVLVDGAFLRTLPPRELRCGLGEIVKHAALDGALFDALSAQDDLTDPAFLGGLVPRNIAFKADVVRRDPREEGLRKCLNLGHTTAHAFELANGGLSHGECVLLGILYEARLARAKLPCDAAYLGALEALCRRALSCAPSAFDVAAAAERALLDKKNEREGEVVCTVPVRKGEYAMLALPYEEYAAALRDAGRSV